MLSLKEKIKFYLCPPGNGVHTVHTAQENKSKLHQKIYQTVDKDQVQKKWLESVDQLENCTLPMVLGVCLDTGGGIQRGANWGPLFIREQLLSMAHSESYFDIGDIKVIPQLLHDKYLNNQTIKECQAAIYQNENLPVSALSIAEDFCQDLFRLKPDTKILSFGGDHSCSYPLVKTWIEAKKSQKKKVAIIHFDAHTDLMLNRLGVDICFATWAYHMLPLLNKPSDMMQFGIRSSGQDKKYWQETLGVQQFWNYDFNGNGLEEVVMKTIDYLKTEKIEEVYISFDIDALDAKYASSTGTPEADGLEPHQCIYLIEKISKQVKITGADVMEVAPFVSSSLKSNMIPEPDTTLMSAALIANKLLEVMK